MPLDHFVPQVHLKNFYSPNLGNRMYAINKKDLKEFPTRSRDVCRIEDGSTNSYLRENRGVEEFLKGIEGKYNVALTKLATNKIDVECIYTIAGFVAYICCCSPAAMRIHTEALKSRAELSLVRPDSQAWSSESPPELAGMNLMKICNEGLRAVDADPKFTQAIGIASIINNTAMFGNFKWEILRNDFEDSAYFTSDYPVALEITSDTSVRNKIVPLSPSLAIRICPNRKSSRGQADLTFLNFSYQNRKLGRGDVARINKLIVRHADERVFFRDNQPWVSRFVQRNS